MALGQSKWTKRERERGREAQFRTGAKGIAAFSFTPEVLCDLGENRYSLNRPGTGGICWLVRGVCMLQGTTKGLHDTCFVLEGQRVQVIYFRNMASPALPAQLGNTPGHPALVSQKQQSLLRCPLLPGAQLAGSEQKANKLSGSEVPCI